MLRARLESEGFKVFASIRPPREGLSSILSLGGSKKGKVKQADFLLFNQQFSALLRAGIPVLAGDRFAEDAIGIGEFTDCPCRC